MDKWDVKIVAIVCLTLLEGAAILTKTDGIYFLPVAAAIGALAGYTLKSATS